MQEQVNHPPHYGGENNPYEVIKVLRAWMPPDEFYGWLRGSILKYIARAGKKEAADQDWAKAVWYSNYLAKWIIEVGYKPK